MQGNYSILLIGDGTQPVRRFDVPRRRIRQALRGAAVAAAVLAVASVDYVRVRLDHGELAQLRQENAAQRERIAAFDATLGEVETKLEELSEFERKVRIIANLPGSAGAGGALVTEVGPGEGGDLAAGEPALELPDETEAAPEPEPEEAAPAPPGERFGALRRDAERLGLVADARGASLAELVEQLESKRHKLASSPSIWPAKGWLTSRFGPRTSPFTGRRQFHSGIDIAGQRGTDVMATARGKVVFAGRQGAMGRTVVIDHGFGVRTIYGHAEEILVSRGQEVERGERIAALGSSGRSTGPHVHYTVEVDGKARNPLDYIFD